MDFWFLIREEQVSTSEFSVYILLCILLANHYNVLILMFFFFKEQMASQCPYFRMIVQQRKHNMLTL